YRGIYQNEIDIDRQRLILCFRHNKRRGDRQDRAYGNSCPLNPSHSRVLLMLTTAFLIMQFIISAKAGLVNAVEGDANVRVNQQVNAGAPIRTEATGRVEIQLNPGSFLRLGENSEAVLDSVDLTDIQVRIVSGIAIIESTAVDKSTPIHVTDGDRTQLIA